jgi:predicted RNA-binding Zn-ribbon protein involved in translation (DUF1610 family)
MTDEDIDNLAKLAADHVAAGGTIEVVAAGPACKKCGGRDPYRYNGSPNWMNRWTCPQCGRHESR